MFSQTAVKFNMALLAEIDREMPGPVGEDRARCPVMSVRSWLLTDSAEKLLTIRPDARLVFPGRGSLGPETIKLGLVDRGVVEEAQLTLE
jgi:hypothetical protein